MKKFKLLIFPLSIMVLTCIMCISVKVSANTSAPYYTYTADSSGNLIKTTEAYTPAEQIYTIDGERFEKLEHIFIDKDDYIYITDSKGRTAVEQKDPTTGEVILNPITGNPTIKYYVGKVVVLDKNLNLVAEIYNENFKFIKSTFVTEDKIYVVDITSTNIYIFDKEELINNNQIKLIKTISKPNHPIFQSKYDEKGEKISSGYSYMPEHIAVDPRGNIYVQGLNSKNGLIMLDDDGSFMTFFGGNPLRIPIVDRIRSFFLTEAQEEDMQDRNDKKIIHDVPSNIAIDEKGYVYTVTSSIPSNPIKKFNVSGRNYFKRDMIGTMLMNSIWIGQYNNVYAVNDDGYIFEYDTNGNLLFLFGGKDFSSSRVGLLTTPVSIAANSKDQLLVIDQSRKLIQIYSPTQFANSIHEAFNAYYKEGDYEKSREKWEYILQYNSLFDYAHIGLGDAFMRNHNYSKAYQEYYYAKDYSGISDSYWGIRQEWMKDNLNTVFFIILLLIIVRIVYYLLNKYYNYSNRVNNDVNILRRKSKTFDELLYIFQFLKQPFDGFYAIKRENRVSIKTSTIIYILLGSLVVFNYKFTNIIFIREVGVNITYELFNLAVIVILWVISNYLVCAINDGEGSFKNVYNATAYSLTPILVIMPFIIVFSNILTLQEYVFYQFGYLVMTVWTIFLIFFMIKDIHNYNVRKTIGIIFKSMFTMLIIGLFLFVINALSSQMYLVIKEIIVEVVNR